MKSTTLYPVTTAAFRSLPRLPICLYISKPVSFSPAKSPARRRENLLRRAGIVKAAAPPSAWDDKPYEILPSGGRAYLDEEDVLSFVDPPRPLIPIDSSSYNPALYLWKKIGDIPEDRRHRLLFKLKARHISRIWEITGARYEDVKLSNQSSSVLLSLLIKPAEMEVWSCRTKEGPLPVSWMNDFKMVFFSGKDGEMYGRILIGGLIPSGIANMCGPLYFKIKEAVEVMATEQPCDLAFEFGNGIFDLKELPEGFPQPAEHSWPVNDNLVIYIRHAGPGMSVGQAWQEGRDLEQVPKKFCGEILMVKDQFFCS